MYALDEELGTPAPVDVEVPAGGTTLELVLTCGTIAVLDVETPGRLLEVLEVIVVDRLPEVPMLGVPSRAEAPSHVATQYALPASILGQLGGSTEGFQDMKVSTGRP